MKRSATHIYGAMIRATIRRFNGSLVLLAMMATSLSAQASGEAASKPATTRSTSIIPIPSMPDPLIGADGKPIGSLDQWRQEQRTRIKEILEQNFLGHAPPPPGNVSGRIVQRKMLEHGTVTFHRIHVTFGPGGKMGFEMAIFLPAKLKPPFPTIVHIGFSPTPGTPPPAPDPTTKPTTKSIATQKMMTDLADPTNAVKTYLPALSRGYAVATFYYQQFGVDRPNDYRKSGFFPDYPNYDWCDLAAWAWGMSRCVDYLETQSFVDKSKIIALGHSRLGKTTLIAGAFDDRFALVAPAGSGCCGTGAFRVSGKMRGGKEGLEDVLKHFPQWISPNMAMFAGMVDTLPFDQHWLIALCAPRPFIAADALDDPYCNGLALAQSWLAAKPAYEFFGAEQNLAIHYRPGGHELGVADWKAILDFADQQLRGIKTGRRFDQLPPAKLLH